MSRFNFFVSVSYVNGPGRRRSKTLRSTTTRQKLVKRLRSATTLIDGRSLDKDESASASGGADYHHRSAWESSYWYSSSSGGSGSGSGSGSGIGSGSAIHTFASGGTHEITTHDDYDYRYALSETYHANGSVHRAWNATNDVSGTIDTSGTYWWNNDGQSGSGSWSWDDSYSHTVGYPGFYTSPYYSYSGGGSYLSYIGDMFGGSGSGYGSGGGYGGYAYGDGDGGYLLDSQDQQSTSPDDGSELSSSRPTDNGQDRPGDPRGKGPPGKDRQHPGQGRSAEHHRSPVWSHRETLDRLSPAALPAPSIRYEVDAAGNLLSVTDALGHRTEYTYDSLGNASSVTDPNGDTTKFAHDASGNLLVLTDPLGNQTAWTYDDAGRMTGEHVTIDGIALSRTFDYDAAGNLVRQIDRNGRVRAFDYDQDGRLVSEIWYHTLVDAQSDQDRQNTITWTYDESGNLLSVVDDFSSYFYAYDSSGRVTTQIVSNVGAPVTVLTTDYGERLDNQPVSRSATVDGVPDFVNLYEYDDQDRLVALNQTGQGASAVADKLVTFEYNDNGQFVTITRYASLDGSQLVAVSDYAYDQYGRPVSLLHHQPPSDQAAIHPEILPTKNRQRTNAAAGHNQSRLGLRPDPVGTESQPTKMRAPCAHLTTEDSTANRQLPTDNPLAEYTWTWEGGGDTGEVVQAGAASGPQFGAGWMLPFGGTVRTSREVEITPLPDHVWTFDTAFIGHLVQTTSTDGIVDYQYDPRGQLIGADYTAGAGLPTVPPDELYTYDANGNRTNPGYVTGDHNRLLSDGAYDFRYDAEGNRTRRTEIATGEVTEYHWDHRNRLVRVTTRTTDNGPLTTDTSYAYDYLNRWIARTHDPDGDGPLGFTDTFFVYDGTPPNGSLLDRAAVTMENIGQIVLHFEADGQGDPQRAHRYLWGPAIDQILADEQVTDPTAPGNVVWPLTDHLNTVRDLAVYDADSGTTTIVNHLIYDAYGRITSQTDPDHTTLFAFTARPFDPATGLQNNLNRWYDAEVGRWMSEDPIGFDAGDANLYRYVENVPTVYVDPEGLEAEHPNAPGRLRRAWERFWWWARGTGGAIVPNPMLGALEGLPDKAQIGLIDTLRQRYERIRDANPNPTRFTQEEIYAWREYEAYKNGGPRGLREFQRDNQPPKGMTPAWPSPRQFDLDGVRRTTPP